MPRKEIEVEPFSDEELVSIKAQVNTYPKNSSLHILCCRLLRTIDVLKEAVSFTGEA